MTTNNQTLQQGTTLQDRIVRIAEGYVGKEYKGLCGQFVRDVLAAAGIKVEGRLRDFGIPLSMKHRAPGDVLLYYGHNDPFVRYGKDQTTKQPYWAAIMGYAGTVIGMRTETIVKLDSLYFTYSSRADKYLDNFIKLRRVPENGI